MSTNIWHLEEFFVKLGADGQETQIWLRVRSGTLCRVFTLTFDLSLDGAESSDLEQTWQNGWTGVDTGMQTVDAIRECVDFPGDLEKRWRYRHNSKREVA